MNGKRLKFATAGCVAVLGVIVTLAVSGTGSSKPAPARETAVVSRGELRINIETKGQFQTERSVTINPAFQGMATLTYIIADGAAVKKGDLLARFDTQDVEDEIRDHTLSMDSCANDIIQAEEALKILHATSDAEMSAAELKYRMAKVDLDQYGEVAFDATGRIDEAAYANGSASAKGDAYKDFRDAQLEMERAQSDLEQAQRDLAGMDKLVEKQFVPLADLWAAQQAVRAAEMKLESKQIARNILRDYTYPQTLAQRRQDVDEAASELEKTRLSAEVKINQAETRVRSTRLRHGRYKQRLDRETKELEARTIVSPADGTALIGDPEEPWIKDNLAVGQRVYRGWRLFTIPDTSSIIVQTRVLEMDVDGLAVGQEAEVTVDAVTALAMRGKVTKISEYASSDSGRMGMSTRGGKTFDVTIALDGTDPRLKPGMSCNVEIISQKISDALYVPVSCVVRRGDAQVCTVIDGETERDVRITTGRASEKYVEVKSGLQEGWKVLVADSRTSRKQQGM